MSKGCAGADLLAYRATESDPLRLVSAAKQGLGDGYLIVAGSVSTPAQIGDLASAGADAFTIGSAVFDGAFSPRKGALQSQLDDVLSACD
jgi:putative N-acetylmannosamine-6-phosphate epimerase